MPAQWNTFLIFLLGCQNGRQIVVAHGIVRIVSQTFSQLLLAVIHASHLPVIMAKRKMHARGLGRCVEFIFGLVKDAQPF